MVGRIAAAALVLGVALAVTLGPPSGAQVPLGAGREPGRLQGSVTLGPKLTAHRMNFSLYPDPARAGAPRVVPDASPARGEIENTVVYLVSAPPDASPPRPQAGPFRIEQLGLSFKPHVLVVVKGATVEFPNRDALFHNVFSLSNAAAFDLGRYPRDASKSVRFPTPGIVPVFCHIHSDMSGVIVVLDNPFFAVPDARGHYSIDGVPPGTYRVLAWHERARPLVKTVRIDPGQVTAADFSIPLTEETPAGD
jgi:plastocyanin